MASFAAVGTPTSGSTNSLTPGIPTGSVSGQLCLVVGYAWIAATGTPPWTVSAGWTKLYEYGSAGNGSICAAYKFLVGSDTNPTISYSAAGSDSFVAVCATFNDVNTTSVLDIAASLLSFKIPAGSPYSTPITGVTTATADALAINIYGLKDNIASTISNYTERIDTGTSQGSDCQLAFATKAMPAPGGTGLSTITYNNQAADDFGLCLQLVLKQAANSVAVSPPASTFKFATVNPTVILGSLFLSPQPSTFKLKTVDPTVTGSIEVSVTTYEGGNMIYGEYALILDGDEAEIGSTGNYVQGDGLPISNLTNDVGNMWMADDFLLDAVAETEIGYLDLYDSSDNKLCRFSFSPPITITQTEYTFNWPLIGLEFPSSIFITPDASTFKLKTVNPTVLYGSTVAIPTPSSFRLTTVNPTIPQMNMVVYFDGSPGDASYVLLLNSNGDELATSGNYVNGTGIALSNVDYTAGILTCDNINAETLTGDITYADIYDSDDVKLIRFAIEPQIDADYLSLSLDWPTLGVSFGEEIMAVAPTVTIGTVTTGESFAVVPGEVTSDGGAVISARGVCYSTSPDPTLSDSYVTIAGTTGSFSANISGLTSGTYYAAVFATNEVGTGYSDDVEFTTSIALPTGYWDLPTPKSSTKIDIEMGIEI